MIKKFSAALLFSFLFLGMFSKAEAIYLDLEGRVGYVLPTAHSGKRLFSGAPLAYQLEASAHFGYFWTNVPWKVWLNTTWIPGTGHLRRLDRKHHDHVRHFHKDEKEGREHHHGDFEPRVSTNWIPVSLGLKYSWGLCGFGDLYLGLGGSFSYIRLKVRNDFFERKSIKKQFGVVFKSGWHFSICNCITFDLFADYHITSFGYHKRHKHFFELNTSDLDKFDRHRRGHRQLNINSFMLGGGLGVVF